MVRKHVKRIRDKKRLFLDNLDDSVVDACSLFSIKVSPTINSLFKSSINKCRVKLAILQLMA